MFSLQVVCWIRHLIYANYALFFHSLIVFYFIVLGQSGGVDEDLFTKSFEDVPKLQVGLSYKNIHEDNLIHEHDIVSHAFLIHQYK